MSFPVMGSVYNLMKMTELNAKWKQNKDNPNKLKKNKEEEDPQMRQIKQFKEDLERMRKGNIISNLDTKLKSGGMLTDEELEYLKANNPELYQEAIDIKREREEYKKQLQSCKTKEDVEKLKANKMQNFMTAVHAIKGNPNIPKGKKVELLDKILRRSMAIEDEHVKFIQSKDYEELPTEEEINEESKKRKKKKLSVDEDDIKDLEDSKTTFNKLQLELSEFYKENNISMSNEDSLKEKEDEAVKAESIKADSNQCASNKDIYSKDMSIKDNNSESIKTYNSNGDTKEVNINTTSESKSQISIKV